MSTMKSDTGSCRNHRNPVKGVDQSTLTDEDEAFSSVLISSSSHQHLDRELVHTDLLYTSVVAASAEDDTITTGPSATANSKNSSGISLTVTTPTTGTMDNYINGYRKQYRHRYLVSRWIRYLVILAGVTVVFHKMNTVYINRQSSTQQQTSLLNHQHFKTIAKSNGVTPNVDNGLQIAWLMSFPNSGTSYTSELVRTVSMTKVGSNYGIESIGVDNVAIPVFPDQPEGPFYVDPIRHGNLTQPTNFIFTKTHCGGFCERCGPHRWVESTYSFRHRCSRSKYWRYAPSSVANAGGMNVTTTISSNKERELIGNYYSPQRVTKAVHLIRNPFDNAVSRFHLELKIGKRPEKNSEGRDYTATREGFRAFCGHLSGRYDTDMHNSIWMTEELEELTKDVPCRSDLFRYIHWHNLAETTIHDLQLDAYILHYDWYSTKFDTTVDELLYFLQLARAASPPPFEDGKVYTGYYTDEERTNMSTAFEWMSSPTLWKQIEQYMI